MSTRGHIGYRAIVSRLLIGACYAAAGIVILPLALIVWHLIAKGWPALSFFLRSPSLSSLSFAFFTQMPKPVGEAGGGMANAIVGTLILVGLGALFAVPIGVGAGVYLSEFGRGRFAGMVRYTADLLGGVPSIVVGVAAYGLVVIPMGGF
jgi:phosphate transport system permease protein